MNDLGNRVAICRKCPDRAHNQCVASGPDNLVYQECCRVGYCPRARFGKGSDDPARKSSLHQAVFAAPPVKRGGLSWLIKGAAGLAKAKLGIDAAPEWVQHVRRRTCMDCPQAIMVDGKLAKCRACGCHLMPKTSLAHEHCPEGRWPAAVRVAIVQPGRAGDLLSLLPSLKWLADHGQHVTVFVDELYRSVCERFAWLKVEAHPNASLESLLPKARAGDFEEIRVTAFSWDRPAGRDYLSVQGERTGCPLELMEKLPLDLSEARDADAEAEVVRQHLPPGSGPLVLFNATHFRAAGRPAAFPKGPELLAFLRQRFPHARFLDLGGVRAPRIIDLMGLYDAADLLVSTDSGTLHLGYANRTHKPPIPTVGLSLDDPQRGTPQRTHWVDHILYSEALRDFSIVADAVSAGLDGPLCRTPGTAFIQLGRSGDIVNVLPLMRERALIEREPIHCYVTPEFAPILEAVSYVTPVLFDGKFTEVRRAIATARRRRFDRIEATQVYGNPTGLPRPARNCMLEPWVRAGCEHLYHDLPLVFDRRDREGEAAAIERLIGERDGRPILAYCLKGHSAPFPHPAELEQWMREEFTDYQLVNLGHLVLPKVHHLLGPMELADVLLLSDSLPLHLSYAFGKPTIALLRDTVPANDSRGPAWHSAEPRKHWVGSLRYSETTTTAGKSMLASLVRNRRPACAIALAANWYDTDPEEQQRFNTARRTWESLVRERGWRLAIHTIGPHTRTSRAIGDTRQIPYVRDLIDFGAEAAGEDGIVVYANTDICLVPESDAVLRRKLAMGPCAFSRRIDVHHSDTPRSHADLSRSKPHPGTDLFAFRASFWRQHREEFPDLFVGCEGWDFVYRWICRKYYPDAEIDPPIIYHQGHDAFWGREENIAANPAQAYNRRACTEWARANGFEKAIDRESRWLFKVDGSF